MHLCTHANTARQQYLPGDVQRAHPMCLHERRRVRNGREGAKTAKNSRCKVNKMTARNQKSAKKASEIIIIGRGGCVWTKNVGSRRRRF